MRNSSLFVTFSYNPKEAKQNARGSWDYFFTTERILKMDTKPQQDHFSKMISDFLTPYLIKGRQNAINSFTQFAESLRFEIILGIRNCIAETKPDISRSSLSVELEFVSVSFYDSQLSFGVNLYSPNKSELDIKVETDYSEIKLFDENGNETEELELDSEMNGSMMIYDMPSFGSIKLKELLPCKEIQIDF